jgi:hypothetical protein
MLHLRNRIAAMSLATVPTGGSGELPTGGDNRHLNQKSLVGEACDDQ